MPFMNIIAIHIYRVNRIQLLVAWLIFKKILNDVFIKSKLYMLIWMFIFQAVRVGGVYRNRTYLLYTVYIFFPFSILYQSNSFQTMKVSGLECQLRQHSFHLNWNNALCQFLMCALLYEYKDIVLNKMGMMSRL